MPLTDIAKIHSRDRKGGSSSATDFLQWPVESGTPPVGQPLNMIESAIDITFPLCIRDLRSFLI